ncbi:diaminobutyrate--2-oxoglutarate transaminase [Streptomyces sp. RB6PN25]|uniref:Diaminobutyrate--2-oxoglutarate transaminase n=1 Tax=Streptomyces humicola TaxID=2953240 RepID=A0ABT1Q0Q4_9ACTN|nr:diaminobutyrate--2-oxoglutarate transaminase [Streptomyces humicola]MCQ4083519.1 diaminobutyrate--2-oxoglutarate transaminase [Streptomyces humicola]
MSGTDTDFPVADASGSAIPADLASLESEVRSYSRAWPAVFRSASGSRLRTDTGDSYLDFFAGAGSLNYGHNNPVLKRALLEYLDADGITHGLDMMTSAKADFLRAFQAKVLDPRGLDHKVQFTGPTGTNAVEAALKLARKVTGRHAVAAFTHAFHGMSLGSLAVTAGPKQAGAGIPVGHTLRLPYDGFGTSGGSGLDLFEELLKDCGSGVEVPAAVIVETVQGEGGVNVASVDWLQRLASLCERWEMLLILDDVQTGCGRTGHFFSFESAGIRPDLVCLSKSISGYGLPMALLLLRPQFDVWKPGEHNGTFRGNNPAFVTATAALANYWADSTLTEATERNSHRIGEFLDRIARAHPEFGLRSRGRGLMWGIAFDRPDLARLISRESFARGLVIETSGAQSQVLKILPPLTITEAELDEGLGVIGDAIDKLAAF